MLIQINLKSRMSIHDQLVEGIKELIVAGVLKPDDKLLSIREMAAQLTINPNTIQKAYRELERQSYIYSVKGKGSFVMNRDEVADDEKIQTAIDTLKKQFQKARYLGIEKNDLIQLINETYDSQEDTK